MFILIIIFYIICINIIITVGKIIRHLLKYNFFKLIYEHNNESFEILKLIYEHNNESLEILFLTRMP